MAGDTAEDQVGKTIASSVIGMIVPFGEFFGPATKTGN
jgi:hypothetical protein